MFALKVRNFDKNFQMLASNGQASQQKQIEIQ